MLAKSSKLVSLQEEWASDFALFFLGLKYFKIKTGRGKKIGKGRTLNKTGLKPHEDKSSLLCFKSYLYPDGGKSTVRDSLN